MTQKSVTANGYNLVWVEPILIDKIGYSKTATTKIGALLASSSERLYIRDIVVVSPDATDTNNIVVDFYVKASDAATEGATTTTTVAIGDWIGGTKYVTANAGEVQKISVDWLGDAGEDLIADITVAAGTPTLKFAVYYKKIS
ncbi:hypothetical protein DRN98_06370 [Methanosarcinales archaeon]|nr:MAG: hypothetical protein DRN98_06370 [Methanosarcinales archaeon]